MQEDKLAIDRPAQELLIAVSKTRGDSNFKQGMAGFKLAFGAVKYLSKTPALWPAAAIPAIITTLLFVIFASVFLYFSSDIFSWFWEKPDSWLAFFWWIGVVLAGLLAVGLAYVSAIVGGSIAAGPFNDTLSQRMERRVQGRTQLAADDLKANIRGVIRGTLHSLGNFAVLAMLMVPILMLNLIPGIGSIASSALSLAVSGHFLAFEFMDWSLERRDYSWRAKWGCVQDNRPLAVGFGVGTSILLWIPIVNFLVMPIAVLGGTVLALELHERQSL